MKSKPRLVVESLPYYDGTRRALIHPPFQGRSLRSWTMKGNMVHCRKSPLSPTRKKKFDVVTSKTSASSIPLPEFALNANSSQRLRCYEQTITSSPSLPVTPSCLCLNGRLFWRMGCPLWSKRATASESDDSCQTAAALLHSFFS